jgi:hypothetical protein
MTETKAFPTAVVLSTITGRLLCDIGGIYEVLSYMTGESVFTHQIPRISREAEPVILAAHPHLREAVREAALVNPDNWQEWRDRWIERYGAEIAVPKMTAAEHKAIDPITELQAMAPNAQTAIAVVVDPVAAEVRS